MPPDTRTETTAGIKWKAQENNYQNENKHCDVCLDAFIFQACKPRVMRARPGEYLGSFVFLDFYFLLEAFTIDPPPDQKRFLE